MGHISNKWILSFMLSYLPRYFSDFFDFSLETDGLLSSLPFVGRIISGLIAGYMSDWMIRKGLSICRTRKLFQTIGCWGCAVFSLFIALIPGLNSSASIALLVLALSFQNLTSVAFRINLLDIAPRYAGLLNGVVSTVATLISLPAPVVTSLLIAGLCLVFQGSRDGWLVVFCLVAGFNIVGGLIFVLFAQGDIQDWATSDYSVNVVKREVTAGQGKQPDVENGIFVTETSTRPLPLTLPVVNGKPLREVKSVPASLRRGSKRLKAVARRASMDVGSLIKNVQNSAFSNLALADL
ncbi:sialin-like [Physella acuta]|uniref:sialin-like n=1 Tax=Physella acuta TaxID=109671 RepID=UPI0027DB3117|nr:sialin-like [Physella acuta]